MKLKNFLSCIKLKDKQTLIIKYDREYPTSYEITNGSVECVPEHLLNDKIKTLWFVNKTVYVTLYYK